MCSRVTFSAHGRLRSWLLVPLLAGCSLSTEGTGVAPAGLDAEVMSYQPGYDTDDVGDVGDALDAGEVRDASGEEDAAVVAPDAADDPLDIADAGFVELCGNGVLDPDERCDPALAGGMPGACPSSCSDDAPPPCFQAARVIGAGCQTRCEAIAIASCDAADGCCPSGCTSHNDSDCAVVCGNGTVEGDEVCDGNCPADCDDHNACTSDVLTGAAGTCDARCEHTAVSGCDGDDGCCAPDCGPDSDSDCSASCGDQQTDPGESCDGDCPSSCDDGDACTSDLLSGDPAQCNVSCSHVSVTACTPDDGCCSSGCHANTDSDCEAACGNGVVEPGEECEPSSSSDPSCSAACLLPSTECLASAERRGQSRANPCIACSCTECTTQLAACYDATDVATAGPASGVSRALLCADLVTCMRVTRCSDSSCYCGTNSGLSCAVGANGPCKSELENAAETTSGLLIQLRTTNTSYAIGRAHAVSSCRDSQCERQCRR